MADMREVETPKKLYWMAETEGGDRFLVPQGTTPEEVDRLALQRAQQNLQDPRALSRLPQHDPTVGMSPTQKRLAGMGQAVSETAFGAQQALGLKSLQDYTEKQRLDAPLLRTPEGQEGQFGGYVAQGALLPARRMASGILGGAGFMGAQPTEEEGEREQNVGLGAVGGALGTLANKAIGLPFTKGVPRMKSEADAARAKAMMFLEGQGFPVTYAEKIGTKGAKNLERMLQNLPGSAGWFDDIKSTQQVKLNNMILGLTKGDVGRQFQEFGKGKAVTLDEQFFGDLASIKQRFQGLADIDAPNSALKAVAGYVGETVPNPALDGLELPFKTALIKAGVPETIPKNKAIFEVGQKIPFAGDIGDFNNAYALRSLYANRAYNATDPADASAYKAISKAFDDLFERQFPGESAKLKEMQGSYLIERLLAPTKDAQGNYQLGQVAQKVRKKDAETEGILNRLGERGDTLRNIAQSADFVKPAITSGTAENVLWQRIATLGMLSGGGGLGYFAGGPGGAASMIGGLYGAPWLVNRALQARRVGSPATAGILNRVIPGAIEGPLFSPNIRERFLD